MFKFKLERKQPEENEARRRLQKELFGLNKICDRGFPSRPSALAYDSQLKLVAIGTHAGEIRIYGQPGFQLSYSLDPNPSSLAIQKLIFLDGVARLLVLTVDGYLHLLEMNNYNSSTNDFVSNSTVRLDRICTSSDDDAIILKNTTTICLLKNHLNLLIGLNDGNIYLFHIENFSLNTTPIIPTEIIEKTIVEYCSGRVVHPGPVKSIVQHPTNEDKILIGYKNTLIVHWDLPSNSHDRTYIYKQEVESVCWYNKGMNFATCHSNGSYALWDAKQQLNIVETEKIPYGPYPCTPTTKICVKTMRNGDPLIIFAGGLPRSSYSNKHSVSCLTENEHDHNNERTRHVTFDFTTAVIDFFTIDKVSSDGLRDDPQSLVILLHEEIVVIDLVTDSWPSYHLPYLNSIHTSPVICTSLVCNINPEFYKKLTNYATIQFDDYSDRKWPIIGGEMKHHQTMNAEDEPEQRHLLLTGHEDGSVQFWDVTNISMPLVCKLKTSDYFQIEQAPIDDTDEETWPPFRKTGLFDPYCDDPRLAIQKISLCTNTETLIVAGTAGQVLTFEFSAEPMDVNINTTTVNLLEGCESFVWKGHEEMKTKGTFVPSGFVLTSCVQLFPPAAVSALALCSEIQTYAVGTAHGFTLFQYKQNRVLMAKCTLDPNALGNNTAAPSSTGESTLIRGRSLKKSLRESFRRLRKGRTIKKATMLLTQRRPDENNPLSPNNVLLEEVIRVPVERQVEFREFKPLDDQVVSMVRCLYFAKTYLNSVNDRTRSLWAGTNGGHVYVYSITGIESQLTSPLNAAAIATDQTSTCTMAKEIRLKHKAPVLSIVVLDASNQSIGQGSAIPTVESSAIQATASALTTQTVENVSPSSSHAVTSHKVLICSEEQFKVFSLPNLKPYCKFKLTATEGTRVRKVNINQFSLKTESHTESCLVCLDNMGQISIYTLPNLRRQILFSCIKASDINALSSVQFSPFAHAFYLQSTSELAQVTFSPQTILPYSMSINYDKLQRRTIQRSDFEKSNQSRSPERHVSTGKEALLSTPSKLSEHADGSTITSVSEKYIDTPSKSSVSSSPRKHHENHIQQKVVNGHEDSISYKKANTMTNGKAYQNGHAGNNSGFSTNSDSAIDLSSGITSMNLTNNHHHPSNDEIQKTNRDLPSFQSTPLKVSTDSYGQKDHHHAISPVSPNGKAAAPLAPSAKLISVKVRQAPTINEIHDCNGKSSSPAIHT